MGDRPPAPDPLSGPAEHIKLPLRPMVPPRPRLRQQHLPTDERTVAVKIRLKRLGKIRAPYYRIVVADSRTKRDDRVIEEIGKYHPTEGPCSSRSTPRSITCREVGKSKPRWSRPIPAKLTGNGRPLRQGMRTLKSTKGPRVSGAESSIDEKKPVREASEEGPPVSGKCPACRVVAGGGVCGQVAEEVRSRPRSSRAEVPEAHALTLRS